MEKGFDHAGFRQARERAGYSRRDAARVTFKSERMIHRYETDIAPPADVLVRLLDAYGAGLDDVVMTLVPGPS